MDGDLEDVFPVAQLALIESGGNGRAVLAQENPKGTAACRNDAKNLLVCDGPGGIVCTGQAVFDALEGIERCVVAMLVGNGAHHELVDLVVGERSLIGRSGLAEGGAIAGRGGVREGET